MRIVFAHHLSLPYLGGGEKWIVNTANELAKRGHDVEVYALPFKLKGKYNNTLLELLQVPYHEGIRHSIDADVTYMTYNPLSWLNYTVKGLTLSLLTFLVNCSKLVQTYSPKKGVRD